MNAAKKYFPRLEDITQAKITLNKIASHTPLEKNRNLSEEFKSNIFLKSKAKMWFVL